MNGNDIHYQTQETDQGGGLMPHKAMCCRRQGDVRPIEHVIIDYGENTCSGKKGCKAEAECGFHE